MEPTLDLTTRLDRRLKSGLPRTQTVGTRVTVPEEQELIAAANRSGINVSEWTREILLDAARRPSGDPLLTELTSIRMLLVVLIKPLLLKQSVTAEWVTEALSTVRREKRRATQEMLQQYRETPDGGR